MKDCPIISAATHDIEPQFKVNIIIHASTHGGDP